MSKKDYKHFEYMGHSTRYEKIKNGLWRGTIYLGKHLSKNGTKSNKTKQISASSEKELIAKVKDYIDYNGFYGKTDFYQRKRIEELAREWFAVEKLPKDKRLKAKTLQRIDEIVNNQIIPCFGKYHLDKLDTDEINEILKYLSKSRGIKKGYSHSTLKKIKTYLDQMYRYAIVKKYCRDNPAQYASVPIDERKEIDITDKTLTLEELELYIEAATLPFLNGKPMYRYGWGLVFIAFSGLRCGEALALTWNDIDFDDGIIHVRHNLSDSVKDLRNPNDRNKRITVVDTPKTKSSKRNIVLNECALNALQHLKEITNPDNDPDRPILATENGETVTYRNLLRAHKNIMARAGIRGKQDGIHILRHTFATFLFEKGIDPSIIAGELGHSSDEITRMCYIHSYKDKSNPNVDKLKNVSFIPKKEAV